MDRITVKLADGIIRISSCIDQSIDLIFLVENRDEEEARKIIQKYYDEWWELDVCETLVEWIGAELTKAKIWHEVFSYVEEGCKES